MRGHAGSKIFALHTYHFVRMVILILRLRVSSLIGHCHIMGVPALIESMHCKDIYLFLLSHAELVLSIRQPEIFAFSCPLQ